MLNIIYIHGGETFFDEKDHLRFLKNRTVSLEKKVRWTRAWLEKELTKSFRLIRPEMSCPDRATYKYWKINFERYLPLIDPEKTILIGNSLGASFYVKYLSNTKLKKKFLSLILVAPAFDGTGSCDGPIAGGFKYSGDPKKLMNNCRRVHFLFSEDDRCVTLQDAGKYMKKFPDADFRVFNDKNGHFSVPEFPELIRLIKEDVR